MFDINLFIEDNLPVKNRHCTDKLCFLLLIFAWFGIFLIGCATTGIFPLSDIKEGDPSLLINGVDYKGNICGVSEEVKDYPYRIFPNYYGSNPSSTNVYVPTLFAVCISSESDCPKQNELILNPYPEDAISTGTWNSPYNSTLFLNECLYFGEDKDPTSITTILSDLLESSQVIAIIGLVISSLLSFVFLVLSRIPLVLRGLIWSFSFSILFLLFFIGYYLEKNSSSSLKHSPTSLEDQVTNTEFLLMKIFSYIFLTFGFIWLCILFLFRNRIALAISLVKEASYALISLPLLLLLPFLQTLFFLAFTIVWLYISIYLVSSGDYETHHDPLTNLSYTTFSYDTKTQSLIAFMVFGWLWISSTIEATGVVTSSHSVLLWYFALIRSKIPYFQVFYSLFLAIRYHLGTIACGSLFIGTLKGIRLFYEFVRARINNVRSLLNVLSCSCCYFLCKPCECIAKIFCCCCCCSGTFENILKVCSRHSYIYCALYGTSYIPSAYSAYTLLESHLGRAAAVSVVGDIVVGVAKFFITLLCGLICYFYLYNNMKEKLNSLILPSIFTMFISYSVSTMFLGVLSGVTDALLQAVVVDEKMNKSKFIIHYNHFLLIFFQSFF